MPVNVVCGGSDTGKVSFSVRCGVKFFNQLMKVYEEDV